MFNILKSGILIVGQPITRDECNMIMIIIKKILIEVICMHEGVIRTLWHDVSVDVSSYLTYVSKLNTNLQIKSEA